MTDINSTNGLTMDKPSQDSEVTSTTIEVTNQQPTVTETQPGHNQDITRFYSQSEAAAEMVGAGLKGSTSTVKNYKTALKKIFGSNAFLLANDEGNITELGLQELIEYGKHIQNKNKAGYVTSLESRLPNVVSQPKTSPVQASEAVKATAIVVGNHQRSIEAPVMPTRLDLSAMRGNSEIVSIDDPLALAQRVIAQNAAIVEAMAEHSQAQELKLQQTQQALSTIRASNKNLEANISDYKIDSRVKGALTSTLSNELQAEASLNAQLGNQSPGKA